MTTPVYPPCTCGHKAADHADGAGPCQEPTHRCQCNLYNEMCPKCRHPKTEHVDTGANALCTRIIHITRDSCGCNNYLTPTPM